ncbi:DNA mismatch repair protein [Thoreauomyces humboldtii]|nr:DNA mismatch repair protein [Thoreauomyces humboldtii]
MEWSSNSFQIIHRPANALKEMIENCLDAGASSIQITIKDGGLKLLQIQDNGHGIHKDDLAVVCERFATSKLAQFDDLSRIATYGFRGEALASISHVAHVTITTKQGDSPCAWRACYSDGKLKAPKPGASVDPKPCAGNRGTQIVVEDLFYNITTRRKALKSVSEEYNRILDVVHRYAIHNSKTSFTCKKVFYLSNDSTAKAFYPLIPIEQGASTADVHTSSTAKTLDNIRYVYGATIAKELLEWHEVDARYHFKLDGYVSNANFNLKKMTFLLFINHRSVDSANLKRSIEAVYTEYLPKGTHPFVYLSLEIEPANVDVNVHPTKREVHFLNENQIVDCICAFLRQRLADANESRKFYTQTFLPGAAIVDIDAVSATPARSGKAPEHRLVRTDSRARTLDAYITSISSAGSRESVISLPKDTEGSPRKRMRTDAGIDDETQSVSVQAHGGSSPLPSIESPDAAVSLVGRNTEDAMQVSNTPPISPAARVRRPAVPKPPPRRQPVEVRLTSVLELQEELQQTKHRGLTEIFAGHTFVGFVDDVLALIQYQTKLYMIDFEDITRELFYQLALLGFSNFGTITLAEPVSVRELVLLALEAQDMEAWGDDMMSPEDIAEQCARLLVDRREMLQEYFSLTVTATGQLTGLPVMLRGYVPPMDKLPLFLLRLGSEVVWDSEKECFETFCKELGMFYAVEPPSPPVEDARAGTMAHKSATAEYRWTVEHVVFPALKGLFAAPRSAAENRSVVQVANLPDLYKVFERC